MHAVFGRFVNHISAFHMSPVLDLTSTLNLLDSASLKLQHGEYLFDDAMMRQILVKKEENIEKEVYQMYQERATSCNLNYKIDKAH